MDLGGPGTCQGRAFCTELNHTTIWQLQQGATALIWERVYAVKATGGVGPSLLELLPSEFAVVNRVG